MNDYNFKPFDNVLVRHHSQQEWCADFYSHKNITTSGGEYNEIIPYKGNEALLGTTDAPKPKRWRAEMGKLYYFIDATFCANREEDIYTPMDNYRYNIGNYFRTKEEAEEMAGRIKAMLKGE